MLRSLALILASGTIVVQCTKKSPTSPNAEQKTEGTRRMEMTTPTHTPVVQGAVKASPNSTKTLETPTAVTPKTSTEKLPDCVQNDCNCSDFKTQAEAQAVWQQFPNDPHELDKNNDGVACESLP